METTAPKIRDTVTTWAQPTNAMAESLTKIPLPINPAATLESLKHAVNENFDDLKQANESAAAVAKGQVTQLAQSLTSLAVADLNSYKKGESNAVSPTNPPPSSMTIYEIGMLLNGGLLQRAKTIIAALPGLMREGYIALGIGILLILIGAMGVIQPLMTSAMGANGDPSSMAASVWAVIIATAIALTIGAVNVTFFRSVATRFSPWSAIFVGLAIAILAARYVSAEMSADFMLMQDLPPWAQMTIRVTKAVGVGVALICIEMAAGKAVAFFWARLQTRTDRPRLEEIVRDITEWNRLRAEHEGKDRSSRSAIKLDDLYKTAALIVAETVDNGLEPHRKILRQIVAHVDQPFAGSELEHVDADWLDSQVRLCEQARDDLLRLAGLNPPPTNPSPATPTPVPPAPPATTATIN
jgi:hypothetical protein